MFWSNYTRDELVAEVLLPYVNGHIITMSDDEEAPLLNLKAVSELQVFKTKGQIDDSSAPDIIEAKSFAVNSCTAELLKEIRILQANPNTSSLLQKCFAEPVDQVFVIMKFGDAALDSAYEGVIKPVVAEFGLTALRIDEVQDAGQITNQVLEAIATSRYVLADLSGERPNCYYEAGFAHALGKTLILTIHKKDTIHFDLAGNRFIQWSTESELRKGLRTRLVALSGAAPKPKRRRRR